MDSRIFRRLLWRLARKFYGVERDIQVHVGPGATKLARGSHCLYISTSCNGIVDLYSSLSREASSWVGHWAAVATASPASPVPAASSQ